MESTSSFGPVTLTSDHHVPTNIFIDSPVAVTLAFIHSRQIQINIFNQSRVDSTDYLFYQSNSYFILIPWTQINVQIHGSTKSEIGVYKIKFAINDVFYALYLGKYY